MASGQNSTAVGDWQDYDEKNPPKPASPDAGWQTYVEPKPNFAAMGATAQANLKKSEPFEKANANKSAEAYHNELYANETPLERMQRGHSSITDVVKHGLNPAAPLNDTSETFGKIGDVAQQKSEEAQNAELGRIAHGGEPDPQHNPAAAYDLAARTAHMVSGLTTPKSAAIAGATMVAPEVMAPLLIAHGGYGTYEAGKDIAKKGFTPENTEAGLSSAAEMTGGGAALGEIPKAGGFGKTLTGKVLDKAVRGTPLTEAGKIEAATKQAMTVKQPNIKETDYAARLNQALPDLQAIAKDNAGQIKTPRDAVEAINRHIAKIEEPIGQHVRSLPKEGVNVVAPDDIATNVNKAIDDHVADPRSDHYSGKEVEKARQAVHDLIGDEPKSIADVERIRRRLNKDSSDYYLAKKTGAMSNVASDAEAAFKGAAADAMRDMLYGKEGAGPGLLERAGVRMTDAQGNPVEPRAVRQQIGNLIDIRNHFRDAITRAERTGDWSLWKSMGSGPSLAMGGLGATLGVLTGGPVGAAALGGLAELGKGVYDYQHTPNPNLNTEKMFRNLSQTGGTPNTPKVSMVPPEQVAKPAVQQQLPLPPENAPLFNIQQTPRLRPDAEAPRMAPIQGQQIPLNIPHGPEEAPLFSIPQTSRAVPEAPKLGPPQSEGQPFEAAKPVFRGTAANVRPAEEGALGKIERTSIPKQPEWKLSPQDEHELLIKTGGLNMLSRDVPRSRAILREANESGVINSKDDLNEVGKIAKAFAKVDGEYIPNAANLKEAVDYKANGGKGMDADRVNLVQRAMGGGEAIQGNELPPTPKGIKFENTPSKEGEGWESIYATKDGIPKAHMIVSPEGDAMAVRLVQSNIEGMGYGSALYKNAIEYAKSKGFKRLISDPEGGTSEDAAKIWKRMGAEKVGDGYSLDLTKNSGAVELKPGETTEDRFFNKETKQWAPERQANHDAYIKRELEGKTPPKDRAPEAVITMGGTGSGKSTVTEGIRAQNKNMVNVDSDAAKLDVPEYAGLKKADPQKAAFRVHEEASSMSKQLLTQAVNKGLDFVYDKTTGGSDPALFQKLKDAGYRVRIAYVDLPVETAIARAKVRAESSLKPENRGRVVPEDIIRAKHQEAANAFFKLQNNPAVDELTGYDNAGKEPKPFYTKTGGKEQVYNPDTLERVRAKVGAHEPAGSKK